jgi:Trypsin
MTRTRSAVVAGLVAAGLALAGVAGAISNGVPDGNGHPNVGMLTIGFEEDGQLVRFADCSGSYGGSRVGQPASKVFVTAAHCVAGALEAGIAANQFWVSFDSGITFDVETGAVTSTNTWHQATAIAFDPAAGQQRSDAHDYAVVLLDSVPAGLTPIQFPTAGLLSQLAANGSLQPGTVFDNVGYGVIPLFKRGQPNYEAPPGRMFSTSRYKALTQAYLKLNMNSDSREGNGGSCFGDSGSPKFIHGTNTAVALSFGGDPICRSENINSRLDIAAARSFYGQYLALP